MSETDLLESIASDPAVQPGIWLATFGPASPPSDGVSRTVIASAGRVLRLSGDPDQPMPAYAERASCGAIFDGMLYNRGELRAQLDASPVDAADDADLALLAYLRWGDDVAQKIQGIFALIIWDGNRNVLLCVRDPMGIYPLFYAEADQELLLSTSVDALVRHPRVSKQVNRAAIADHLLHRYPQHDETFYAHVRRVPPGHTLRAGSGRPQLQRYWSPAPLGAPMQWVSEDEVEQRFDRLLSQAVERYMQLGPTGIFLSGGLDSVTVAAVALDTSRQDAMPTPWALSLAFPDPSCNEETLQKGVAGSLGLPQVLVPFASAVGSDGLLLAALERCRNWPVPLLNAWWPAYEHLALEGKRRGCRVILTGGGGDEWLTVNTILAADLMRAGDLKGLYRLWTNLQLSLGGPRHEILRYLLWTCGIRPLALMTAGRMAGGPLRERQRRRFWRSVPEWMVPDTLLRHEIDQRAAQRAANYNPEPDPGEKGFYLRDLRRYLDHAVPGMMTDEAFVAGQRIGMRVLRPFWDADLVDLLCRTPPDLLYKGGRSKGLVRQTLGRRFPGLGFERQKKVWATNFFSSTVLREGPRAWQLLGGTPALAELGIVNGAAVTSGIEAMLADRKMTLAHANLIWQIFSLEAWLQPRL